mgnify:CR=1 FL=1|jgi:HTH-type transcriptional regulator/antitoxin HigA
MSNYIEYNNKIAFHPGYYIKEIVDESGLTQEDFAKRLDTTPKNLSLLIRSEQSLSIDIAMKLSRLIGTSVNYWLNLQNAYDALIAEFRSEEELAEERKVFEYFDYKFFRENYGLPDLPRQKDEQIKALRTFLNVATLIINGDYGISFEKETGEQEEAANKFAQDSLIPSDQYKKFVEGAKFDLQSIKEFANRINRDPGIVLGRLQNDKIVDFNDWILRPLRHKYKVRTMI